MDKLCPVVLCGGFGTRLWPVSRPDNPKQFNELLGTSSLFQTTLARIDRLQKHFEYDFSRTIAVGNVANSGLIERQAEEVKFQELDIILEPQQRNTAPALTMAALQVVKREDDAILVVLPSDHWIQDVDSDFADAVRCAVKVARSNGVAIFGVPPKMAEPGYGYIQAEMQVDATNLRRVRSFVEKPDVETAKRFIEQGDYFWNSGMLVVRASTWISIASLLQPRMMELATNSFVKGVQRGKFFVPESSSYSGISGDSIDYSVLEKLPRSDFPLWLVAMDAAWTDLGTWRSIANISEKDSSGNYSYGKVILREAKRNIIHAQRRLVAFTGIDDVILVETKDAVLVAPNRVGFDLNSFIKEASELALDKVETAGIEHRPWGFFEALHRDNGFLVKKITVNPGHSLSLQLHRERSEHWVVTSGIARVFLEGKSFSLSEGQHTFIPIGARHRISNDHHQALELVEIQMGSNLSEEDILRFEDDYGRVT